MVGSFVAATNGLPPHRISERAPIPRGCMCNGSLLPGDPLFLDCGPPVLAAAREPGPDAPQAPVPTDDTRPGNMNERTHCWANWNMAARAVPQQTTDGN